MKKILMIVSVMLFHSCSSLDSISSGEKSTVELRVTAQVMAGSVYELTISGPGMAAIGPDRYEGGQTVRLFVPEGADRHFELKRYDESGTLTDSGVVIQDVGSGMNKIDISVKPLFRVFYEPNGATGTCPQDMSYYTAGSDAFVLKCDPDLEKEGFAFAGWSTSATSSDTVYQPESLITIGESNDTLYALWQTKKVTVTFDSRDGSAVEPRTLDYNSTVDLSKPAREGYSFKGWFTDADTWNDEWTSDDHVVSDTVLYAKWEALVTVTFNSTGGTPLSSQAIEKDSAVSMPDDPSRPGYKFTGWYTASDYTLQWDFSDPVISDTTLYAEWRYGEWHSFSDVESTSDLDTSFKIQDGVYFNTATLAYTLTEMEGIDYPFAGMETGITDEIRSSLLLPESDTISFSCRADQSITVIFQLRTADVQDYLYHQKLIYLDSNETMDFSIPIGSLSQPTGTVLLDKNNAEAITWLVDKTTSPNVTEGYLSVWDVRIH